MITSKIDEILAIRAVLPRSMRVFRKSVATRRILNAFVNQLSLRVSNLLGKSFVWGYPPSLMIEPTNTCNLRCPLCACGAGELSRPKAFLDFGLYRRVIDEIGKYLLQAQFWNQGEPFLHSALLQMVKYASQKGIYTVTSTNVHFLENAEDIVFSGLDEILLSVDGATEETYLKYRIGGNFKKVLRNIEILAKTRDRLGCQTPYLTFQFVITKFNEHEINRAEKLARNLGTDEIVYKTVEIPPDHNGSSYLPKNERFRRYSRIDPDHWRQEDNRKNCSQLWQQPVLNSDGSFAICCFDKDGMFEMGSLDQYFDFGHFWQSKEFEGIRNIVKESKDKIPICKICTARFMLPFHSIVFR